MVIPFLRMGRVLPLMMVCACAHGAPYRAQLGAPAPRFSATTLNEEWSRMKKVDLEEAIAAHGAVLLSFGASHCGPCMLEWPALRDVAAEYRHRGLLVIFVLLDSEPKRIRAMRELFTEQLGISSPVILDADGRLASRYGIAELPQLYLIDARGEVVWREIGYKGSTLADLTDRLDVMLVE